MGGNKTLYYAHVATKLDEYRYMVGDSNFDRHVRQRSWSLLNVVSAGGE